MFIKILQVAIVKWEKKIKNYVDPESGSFGFLLNVFEFFHRRLVSQRLIISN